MIDPKEITDGITTGIEIRKQRGMEIAALTRIEQRDGFYIVPSQSEPKRYRVKMGENPSCTCADHETRRCRCKHVYAVEFYIKREQNADGSTTVTESVTVTKTRKTYKQDWPNYNLAQQNEKREFQALLADLCKGIDDPAEGEKAGRGRPAFPLRDAVFAIVYKVYSTFSGRRFTSDLCDAQAKGHIGKVPHYNTAFRCIENPELFPILLEMIERTALPLKAIETAVEIHGRDANDAPILPSLVETTAKNFTMKEVCADKGYSGRVAHDAIAKVGATPYIAFKANATGKVGGLFEKMWHYFQFNKETFLARYHQRSNIESTVMMVKTKFGDSVRSKSEVAARNEVLAKFVCHNICCLISAMYELGIEPTFGQNPASKIENLPLNSGV
jgi:hypothetical protein